MEMTIFDKHPWEVSIGVCANWDVWSLPLQVSWWRSTRIDTIRLAAEEVPAALGVPFNPRIGGGHKWRTVGKNCNVHVHLFCFKFRIEIWKWVDDRE